MSSSIDTSTVSASAAAEGQKHFVNSMLLPQNYKLIQHQQGHQQQQQQQQHPQQGQQPLHISSEKKRIDFGGQAPIINANISKYMPPNIAPQSENLLQSNQNCIGQNQTAINRIANGPNQNTITSNECNMNFMNSALSSDPSQRLQSQESGLVSVKPSANQYPQHNQQWRERTIDTPVNVQVRANHLASTATSTSASHQLPEAPVTYQAVTNTTSILSNPVVNPSVQNIDNNLRNLNLSCATNGTATNTATAVNQSAPVGNMPSFPPQMQRPHNTGNFQVTK